MPTYRLVFRPGFPVREEEVEADDVRRESGFVVLYRRELVIFEPREIVVRRVPAADLVALEVTGTGARSS